MDDRRCGTCKHWKRYDSKYQQNLMGNHAGDCWSDKFVYQQDLSGNVKTPVDGLLYWDCEGYMASFNTGENFGCNAWEAQCA